MAVELFFFFPFSKGFPPFRLQPLMAALLLDEELEVLQSIYLDELSVIQKSPSEAALEIRCSPSREEECFVTITVSIILTAAPPAFRVSDSFGLDAREVKQIEKCMKDVVLTSDPGEAICFSAIESAKERLEALNSAASCQVAFWVRECA